MGDRTAIEWASATWNPLRGTKGAWSCIKISPGCEFCYAQRLNVRRGGPEYKVGADTLRLDETILTQPLRWKRPRRIFVCSMTDLFEERVPVLWLDKVFAVMALASHHTFQVLTKRAQRMQEYCSDLRFGQINDAAQELLLGRIPLPTQRHGMVSGKWPLPNVWLGVSVENQARADERIPWLLKTPAAVRFLSVEPLLGPVDLEFDEIDIALEPDGYGNTAIKGPLRWVIGGGESGGPPERALVEKRCAGCGKEGYAAHQERREWLPKPEALEWVRALRDQCVAAGVPFFFKQWGGPTPKSGGRLLDGKECSEFPP